ncbi:nuclear transport factor 2 family protein [Lacinutrix mariniflava]|uniref:nuclear transport factor 2 family protein n=1 Tax=Lacinutrix mariniflava TaxID=342955 RepID=UPI0006E172DE|nr:nuclear transport factor 2 family protein [Lacinutrix mariniflava]
MKHTILLLLVLSIFSCNNTPEPIVKVDTIAIQESNKKAFHSVLNKHLEAVPKKDLVAMKSTLTPNGNMQLILPSTEPIYTNADFMQYHQDWFTADLEWSFTTKVLNTSIGKTHGMAIVEVVYSEPLRNGKPYFNKMIVSYDLQNINGHWYFIKDHASSVKKSTD